MRCVHKIQNEISFKRMLKVSTLHRFQINVHHLILYAMDVWILMR